MQAPDFSQSYNRYSYCINNPLKYTDPTGEFFVGTILTGVIDFLKTVFVKGGIDPWNTSANRRAAWRDFDPTASWSKTNKAWKIDAGGFKTDESKNNAGRIWEFISRWTWQLPQTALGKIVSHGANNLGMVNEVNYFHGATVINTTKGRGGITLGSYILGRNLKPDFRDHLFVHEYGHYRQSQIWGLFYLPLMGIPSLKSAAFSSRERHSHRWFEAQANRYAVNFFDKNYGSGVKGYKEGSVNFFDRNSFINPNIRSPYLNPRNGSRNDIGYPLRGRFHWSDPLLYLYLGLFVLI